MSIITLRHVKELLDNPNLDLPIFIRDYKSWEIFPAEELCFIPAGVESKEAFIEIGFHDDK